MGVPVLLAVTAIVVLFGERLLPTRTPATLPADLSTHAHTLVEEYALRAGVFRMRVRPGSSLIGRREDALDMAAYPGLGIVGVEAFTARRERGEKVIAADDILVVRGPSDEVAALANEHDLALRSEDTSEDLAGALIDRRSGLAEVVIPPRSPLVGTTVFVGGLSDRGTCWCSPSSVAASTAPRTGRAPAGRHAAGPGHMGRAGHAPRAPGRAGRGHARGGPPPGGPDGSPVA